MIMIANSLIVAGKIPGAWLVRIKDAGHALFVQHSDEVNRVLQVFLSTQQTLIDEYIIW
jgi:pimeloyl-ACP methyl ester carboxylesterase